MKKLGSILSFLLVFNISFAQQPENICYTTFKLINALTNVPLVQVQLQVIGFQNKKTDSSGTVIFPSLKKGNYQVKVEHAGFELVEKDIFIGTDTVISINLHPLVQHIQDVHITANSNTRSTATVHTITAEQRAESQGKNLAEVLMDISGVNILKTGSNIAKPVLNGLSGTRVLLINNDVRHESQQWGLDHAPEIDPFTASEIQVLKNADAVRYGPDALAGVILMQPSAIPQDRQIAGSIHLVGQSNGQSGAVRTQLEGNINSSMGFQVGITAKKAGNIKTANYYLGNTGVEELNYNARLVYKRHKNIFDLSYTHFGTELGIFSGAHIGSIEDILTRIEHGQPFEHYDFSYKIEAPRQEVQHDLIKASWKQQWNDVFQLETNYSFQQNHRKEFDLRRVQSDETPMTNMHLKTQLLEVSLKSAQTTIGISGSLQINNNIAGTGTTPLIPNFDNHTLGIFAAHKYAFGKNTLELGVRYDFKYFDVAGYRYNFDEPNPDGTLNQYLLEDRRDFSNVSGVLGLSIPFDKQWSWKSNIGLAWRAPSANELYSHGVHHGTGTYEIGNKDLQSEKGLKWVNSFNYNNYWITANVDLYAQSIWDYIYADPNPDKIRQTIRGTFPIFEYKQTQAIIYGADLSSDFNFNKAWDYSLNYSFVVGQDHVNKTYLPYMPPQRLQHSLKYKLNPKTYFRVHHACVAKQTQYEEGSDYAAPPASYQLFGATAVHNWKLSAKKSITLTAAVENVFNNAYKDYMDRFRYYAHQQGRNITLKINYNF